MRKCVIITISGKVQGVGFRYFLLKQARSFDIAGFAKNLPNGSVYVEAEGQQEMLVHFIEQCRRGPILSRVDQFEMQWCPEQGFREFNIL